MRSSWTCRSARCATPYYARPEGSASKLYTWRDGFRILRTILRLYRAERPLPFFTGIGVSLAIVVDRPRDPGLRHLYAGRHRAAAADRDAVDRPDAAGVPVDRLRPDPRHGDARAARDEAAGLSGAARAGSGEERGER